MLVSPCWKNSPLRRIKHLSDNRKQTTQIMSGHWILSGVGPGPSIRAVAVATNRLKRHVETADRPQVVSGPTGEVNSL